MKQRIIELSEAHPRYGYRRIGALLRREGRRVNPKRVQGIRRQEGLQGAQEPTRDTTGWNLEGTSPISRASRSCLELGHHS